MDKREIVLLKNRIAELAIGPSTLRNQGAPGVVEAARTYMKKMQLHRLQKVKSEKDYQNKLNIHTGRLSMKFPGRAKGNWGSARKSLNIFLRDCLYNRYLCKEFQLGRLEPWLELPLDRYTAIRLRKESKDWLPPWPTIKHLQAQVSRQYQEAAREVARNIGIAPVHLDLHYWRQWGSIK